MVSIEIKPLAFLGISLKRSKMAFLGLFCLFMGSYAISDDWTPQPVGPFGTLNNRDNSYALPGDKAQDLLNVNITLGGKSVKKRDGYGTAFTLTNTTSPVHGDYKFFDSSGNEIVLFFNDVYLSASTNGAAPAVVFSTGPNGATYQCTDSLGFSYCNNTSRTTLIKTNGVTSTSLNAVVSSGTMVTVSPTRLITAGFSDRPSNIDFSKDSDFTTWVAGSLATDPVTFPINSPGAKITHIVYAFGRLIWFKDSSFGYILIGNQPAQSDWVIRTVSYDVGTNDNTSVYREGLLYFKGQDGHFYEFDGANYQKISSEIATSIGLTQTRISNSWTQTTQADFLAGTSTNIDTTTLSGSVQLVSFTDPFSDLSNWTTGINYGGNSGNLWLANSNMAFSTFGTIGYLFCASTKNYDSQYYVTSNINFIGTADVSAAIGLVNSSTQGIFALFDRLTTTSYQVSITSFNIDGSFKTLVSSAVAYGLGADDHTLTLSGTATGYYNLYLDGNYMCTKTLTAPYTNLNKPVIASTGSFYASSYARFDDYFIKVGTGTYRSNVKNALSITNWDSFLATYQNDGGLNTFFIRSASNTFPVTSSTIAWTSISNSAIPTVSTGSGGVFFQIRDDFSITSASQTPKLDAFTQNWFEGSATDKAYATYFDDKIWWEVTYGTGATTNNRTFIYDLLNNGWLTYDLPLNGFYIRQNHLYFGSATGGYIYKFGDVQNDNGAAINAYWKSKDFFGTSPFINDDIANVSIVSKSVASSSMTITYSVNGSSSTSYTMSQYNKDGNFRVFNKNLPGGKSGYSYNLKFGNSAIDQPFEVFAIQFGLRPKSWTPTSP